jgi:DnaJ-class molecular chaperone
MITIDENGCFECPRCEGEGQTPTGLCEVCDGRTVLRYTEAVAMLSCVAWRDLEEAARSHHKSREVVIDNSRKAQETP